MIRRTPFTAFIVGLLTFTPRAFAYEDQYTLEGQIGYAYHPDDDVAHHGGIIGVTGSRGINDVWSARAFLGVAHHPGTHHVTAGLVGGELIYLLDILNIVPFFGAGINGFLTAKQNNDVHFEIGVHAVAGLDYLFSRSWLIGIDVRGYFPTFYVTSGLHVGYLFDM